VVTPQRNKNKARGYFYLVKNNTNFKCHNCGASLSFNNFLKELDPTLHKQYTLEKFKEGHTGKNFVVEAPKLEFKKPVFKKSLTYPKHLEIPVAKEYLEKRKLNPEKFYFADKFKEWTNTQKLLLTLSVGMRVALLYQCMIKTITLIGFQGRALGPNSVKYITVMLDEEAPKIYGLNEVNEQIPIYVVEGPFDSTFVNNSVALCGSDGDVRCLGWKQYCFCLR
jgi:hypothetical protein